MDKWGRGRRAKSGVNNLDELNEFEIELNEFEIELNSDAVFVIKLLDSRSLRVISRSLFLAVVLLALPSIGSIICANSYAPPLFDPDGDYNSYTSNWVEILPTLLHDLIEEGLIRKGHKGLILGSGIQGIEDDLRGAGVDLVSGAGAHQVFDYMYAPNFGGIELMDGVVKDGGLAIAPLGGDLSAELRLLRDFKIVYLRRLGDNTVVAMRKSTALSRGAAVKQCGIALEKKEAALRGLEDVYLEPPRPEKKSGLVSKKIKLLSDLMKDPLDEYPRRVFITDDTNALDWFYKNYLMRGQEFEVYEMEGQEMEGQEMEGDWVAKTGVKAEDYVVMKAEAGVVDRMLRDNTLCVVDEVFLECKNGAEVKGKRRAYWECVALYGRVRDEGIAVHQWWWS